ncbi:hypothetical protein HWV62_28854 [Athelia sp. TMB]|nr:hypothetical protein HWV62_28854 [Athelia sp. TMB]
MKRGAEKQISNMDAEEEDEDAEPGMGLRKADESVLAGRKMRGLPKRASMASGLGAAPPLSNTEATTEAPPVPKLGGFSGFGSATATSSFFSSSPSATFGASFSPDAKPAPTISSSASGATKAFASFLSSAPTPAPAAAPAPKSEEVDPAALKYYKSLRGLNVSFLSAISKAIEQDPFEDVSKLVTHYKTFRDSVQKEFDDAKPKAGASSTSASSAPPTFGTAASLIPKPVPKPAMTLPTPPASFTFGGKPVTPASTAAPSSGGGGGFSIPAPTSFAGFGKPPATTAAAASSAGPPKSAFGSTAAVPDFLSSKPAAESTPKTSPFGNSALPASNSSIFGKATETKTEDSSMEPSSKSEPKPEPTSNPFGGSGGGFSSGGAFGSPGKPAGASPFSTSNLFGSSSGGTSSPPKTLGSFAGFGGAKSGTFGNPVGFGFGAASPSPTPDPESAKPAPATTSAFGSSSSPFTPATSGGFGGSFSGFGAPPAAKPAGSEEPEAEDDSKALPTKNHDVEGEGEEDEETTHTTRCKVFKLGKKDDGSQEWRDIGIGNLRLKKHKTTSARRVLCRNSSTGKILINFHIYSGLTPSVSAKIVTFIGHDENGASVTYRLRTQTEQAASELVEAMKREISIVKGE